MTSITRTARAAAPLRRAQAPGPMVLERYRLHRPLGSGGFGTVWLARDERLERDVAVKVLPRERIIGGRFEREARAAARLSHPGIVTLYEAAVDDDGAYLVSELVRGGTLAELLAAGRLSDRDVAGIGIALCDALAHAHTQGVVHRDVKPSNVLVPEHPATPAQAAKLADFGVARVVGGDSLTRTGDVIGTAAYMAPEQAEGREAGASADLYSLALVLYEALTGINPIAAGTAAQRARRLGAHLPPVRRQRRDMPRELAQAIDLALRPRPRERGSIEELRGGLVASIDQVGEVRGIVDTPWPTRLRRTTDHDDEPGSGEPRPPDGTVIARPGQPLLPLSWPERALSGLAAGAIAAWAAAEVASPAAVAPPAVGLIAGLLVAALPRIGWILLTLAGAASAAVEGHAGAGVVLVLAALVPVVLLFRRPATWPLAAGAPALGLIGLAGAWPALAARGRGPWQRAALGAVGWIWLTLAGPLAGYGLYTRLAPGSPHGRAWMSSFYDTANHVLAPMINSGMLAPALVWGAGAVALPWIATFRSLAVQAVMVTVWSAVLASATATLLTAAHPGLSVRPGESALGAVVGGAVAFMSIRLGRASTRLRPTDSAARLA